MESLELCSPACSRAACMCSLVANLPRTKTLSLHWSMQHLPLSVMLPFIHLGIWLGLASTLVTSSLQGLHITSSDCTCSDITNLRTSSFLSCDGVDSWWWWLRHNLQILSLSPLSSLLIPVKDKRRLPPCLLLLKAMTIYRKYWSKVYFPLYIIMHNFDDFQYLNILNVCTYLCSLALAWFLAFYNFNTAPKQHADTAMKPYTCSCYELLIAYSRLCISRSAHANNFNLQKG